MQYLLLREYGKLTTQGIHNAHYLGNTEDSLLWEYGKLTTQAIRNTYYSGKTEN